MHSDHNDGWTMLSEDRILAVLSFTGKIDGMSLLFKVEQCPDAGLLEKMCVKGIQQESLAYRNNASGAIVRGVYFGVSLLGNGSILAVRDLRPQEYGPQRQGFWSMLFRR